LILLPLIVLGCGNEAKDRFETAKFEELQNNHKHAVQIYEEIVENYPDSEYSSKARERLSELKKQP